MGKDGKQQPSSKQEIAQIDSNTANKYTLPNDISDDLQDAFNFYDTEQDGIIKMNHFRNILHNFGFHRLSKKEIDEELKRSDSQFHTRNFVPFEFVKAVVAYRWVHKKGMDDEALECWNLFDKRGKGITAADLKQVLSSYLEFPVSENDI